MPETERQFFEQQVIADEKFSKEVEEAEQDLLEDFAAGSLTPQEHDGLASWVESSPERKAHVSITRGLLQSSSIRRTRGTRWSMWAAAVAACLLLTFAWPLFHHKRWVASAPQPTMQNTLIPASPATPADVILLLPERLRGGGVQSGGTSYILHAGSPVRMQMVLLGRDSKATYSMCIIDSKGEMRALKFDGLHLKGDENLPYLEVILSPAMLKSGTYLAEVHTAEGVYSQSFRVDLR